MPMILQGRLWVTLVMAASATLAGDLPAQVADTVPLQWSLVPPILPPGARIAVVSGDPTMPRMTTIELIMPNGYRMPPHSHPVDEFVEVKEGTLLVGIGDEMDPRKTMQPRWATPALPRRVCTTTRSRREPPESV